MAWIITAAYIGVLLAISRFTSGKATNDTFFAGERRSPWWAVAFGMLGASLSGVTFVSVPGMVGDAGMTYMQMCLGFIPGYVAVAMVLLPVYYRLQLPSIYSFLSQRFGLAAYHSGAACFVVSKLAGAGVRLFLVCVILHSMLAGQYGVPFGVTAALTLAFIWLYTRRGGIRTLVWTDCVQTLVLLTALLLIVRAVVTADGFTLAEAWHRVADSPMSRIFVFDDWASPRHFAKQFLSGAFIVVVMTGLDQDMMQKNLTCKNIREAQKDMCTYGICFIPVNLLFLVLGVLLYTFANRQGIAVPAQSDTLFPMLVQQGWFGMTVTVLFILGITAAAFSSVDSALTALTTSVCIDLLDIEGKPSPRLSAERRRQTVHILVVALFVVFTLIFKAVNSTSVIDAIYIMASYTYGPLLGLFAFGMFTRRQPRDRWIPLVAVASPLLCYALNLSVARATGYHFGYELLMLNGLLTFAGLWALSLGHSK